MKFAKTLEQSLIEQDVPEEWVEAAIKYKALKKCINKIVEELKFLGLEQNKLKLLINDKEVDINDQTANPSNPIIAQYTLHKPSPESHDIIPILKISLDFSDDHNITDDHINTICQEVKTKIESLLNEDSSSNTDNNNEEEKIIELKEENDGELKLVSSREGSLSPPLKAATSPPLEPVSPNSPDQISDLSSIPTPLKLNTKGTHTSIENRLDNIHIHQPTNTKKREINIILNSDSKFFKMLDEELNGLDQIRKIEENKIINEIEKISEQINISKLKTSDLYKWRELFKIYLDSEIYFKYNEIDKNQQNNETIIKNLNLFIKNVEKSGILLNFKKKSSLVTFNQFISINFQLLKILKFQTINTEALRKILKKFDKQTSLKIQNIYPKLISSNHIFINNSKTIAQSICYILTNSLLKKIPQLDDYSCPICMSIAYKPIKLSCNHLFCVRCLVKLKQQNNLNCPMCRRTNAILDADSSNLDLKNMEIMKNMFPIEVREKLRERDKERYRDLKGNNKDDKCIIV
ncbi:uncharacterized protein KGF55_002224 [Candida pseudojiufengensis]|uniref:uncharacterized protein n=1 Tax=Candida pseudojiufengensis TaxID=497109 RepID=UPI0022252AE3|nr:uncharacterized protein KGF55_002224 [Candida pseudojiufengensis]KAI5964282.1 hypothetical protein KGF55_002224 [Candida pseudojiufengensis]